jgi:tRNA(fMet)-specific endonuclease VapC
MKFLLDTNVVSEPTKQTPSAALLRRIGEHASELAISSITWHELLHGWERCRRVMAERIGAYLADTRGILPVLPANAPLSGTPSALVENVARRFPTLAARSRRSQLSELVLVTANTKDFAIAGLVVDWLR